MHQSMKRSGMALAMSAAAIVFVSCGKEKKSESNQPAPRVDLVGHADLKALDGTWTVWGARRSSDQIAISQKDRTLRADVYEYVGDKKEDDPGRELNCRYRIQGGSLQIYRVDATVFQLVAVPAKYEQIHFKGESPDCEKFVKTQSAKAGKPESARGFQFSLKTDDTTAEVYLVHLMNNHATRFRKHATRFVDKTLKAECVNLRGAFSNADDDTLGREDKYDQNSCSDYYYGRLSVGSQDLSYFKANGDAEIEKDGRTQVMTRRKFTPEGLEVTRVETDETTGLETWYVRVFSLNEWNDLVEKLTLRVGRKPPEVSTEVRIRQSFN